MIDFENLTKWKNLSTKNRLNIYKDVASKKGLPEYAIEKDWWIVHSLGVVFSLSFSDNLVFKGGTSLSKGWNLIDRLSEDIDLVLDRGHLGFSGELSNTQICKLRKKSSEFIATNFLTELNERFREYEFDEVSVSVDEKEEDPRIIYIEYPSLTNVSDYLPNKIQLEIGSRSLTEPSSNRYIQTFISQFYKDQPFADNPRSISMVNPERTFLEKIFLLHEEFQKPSENIRVEKMSRHLYDIEKIMGTEYADEAFKDKKLFNTIKEHREKFNKIKGVDYNKHTYQDISIIPPADKYKLWKEDYNIMKENMIYGEPLSFEDLIKRIEELEYRIHNIHF